ncbi:MAG: bifunctional folylpolyglutamate synthase/dihydrofolate synthase [Aquificota bacterium]|nr:MAG: bifunctional folylpolyglutamate synthase/dihydrofolate synthase [Aquificota bacterium]
MKLFSLFNKKVFHIEPGLERIKAACEFIGNPEKNFRSVLISGTNGKGSTASFLESLFRHHGLKTGLFTSPHLIKENERWQINRKEIHDRTLEEYIYELKPVIERFNLTYFEASTLLAFKYFSDEHVDIAVLEVGLGGKWDSTNVVNPEISIITNVSLDHTHLLGNSTEEIAEEKLGIARKDKPLIIGSEQMEIISKAILKGIREIYHYPIGFSYKKKAFNRFDYFFKGKKLKNLEISLLGGRQISNASTALTGFFVYSDKKGINVEENKIREALKNAKWKGRMEIVSQKPLIIVDGAHNEDAIIKTLKEIEEIFPNKKLITVYSGMKDKDWKKILNIISYKSKKVLTAEMSVSRGIKAEEFEKEGYETYKNVNEAIKKAVYLSDENSVILITGSLYFVGEALSSIVIK